MLHHDIMKKQEKSFAGIKDMRLQARSLIRNRRGMDQQVSILHIKRKGAL